MNLKSRLLKLEQVRPKKAKYDLSDMNRDELKELEIIILKKLEELGHEVDWSGDRPRLIAFNYPEYF